MANIAKKSYLDHEGKETRAPTKDWRVIRFSFGNGEVLDMTRSELEGVAPIAAAHGIAQKIGDSYAESKGDIDIAHALAVEMFRRLRDGTWNVVGEGGVQVTMLAQALADVTGRELAECVEKVRHMSKEEKADLRKHKAIAAALRKLELERAQAKAAKAEQDAQDAPALPIDF